MYSDLDTKFLPAESLNVIWGHIYLVNSGEE